MTQQTKFPILKWGVVINQADPDIVVHLKHQFVNGEITYEEFQQRIDEL